MAPAALINSVSRRTFLRASTLAMGGLFVSLHSDRPATAQERTMKIYPPDAFVHVRPDGTIAIQVNRLEFGQGIHTALPMILADEMDADWSHVVAELAPAADVYADPVTGIQMVGSSSSITDSFTQYRELGARARAMLVAAAADRWGIQPRDCRTESSVVYGQGGRSATYAELADAAARMSVPEEVRLKSPDAFRLIGRKMRRMDSRPKCDGSLKFGLDLDVPKMNVALVAHPPVFGARVKWFDDTATRAIEGVRDVFEIPLVRGTAVAVVADKFWPAKQGRDRLKIEWDVSGVEPADSAQLFTKYRELARRAGNVAVARGDVKAIDAIAQADRIVADYEFPFLAHTPMEPLNTTIRFDGDRAEVWAGSQFQTFDQLAIAEVLGLTAQQVTFHTEMAGGGFGRRAVPDSHIQREAAAIAKRVRGVPVKLMWTRENDVQGGYYRPMHVHRVEVGIGPNGLPTAWRHVVVGQSLVAGTVFASMLIKNGVDSTVVEGAADTPYAIPNFHLSAHHPTINVPVLWLRSVGHTHTAFVIETLVDELATRARMDPIAYRLKLLNPDAARIRSALTLLQEKAAWRHKIPQNHAVGIASHESFGTAVACAAEVSIEDKRPKIHRVTVTVKGGRVEQRNFDGYTPPYIKDAPRAVDVHIVPSGDEPKGCGEPPVPVIAPAVVNAVFKLTGKRHRTLPLTTL